MKRWAAIILGVLVTLAIVAYLATSKLPVAPLAQLPFTPQPKVDVTKVQTEAVATNLSVPWSLEFAPDGRLFFTERTGAIRIIADGKLVAEAAANVPVAAIGEGGNLGLAIDPDFASTRAIFVYYTYGSGNNIRNKVVRYTEQDGKLTAGPTIIENIPGASIHNGGRMKFGPDGMLYITAGDASNTSLAQDKGSLAGKILRINKDGSIPADNPFAGSPVYSFGHRNPQGLAWHPETKQLYASEHGSQAYDEINSINAGSNYGWPTVRGSESRNGLAAPMLHSGTTTWAPSGMTFYAGDNMPAEWRGRLFFAGLRGTSLYRATLSADGRAVDKLEPLYAGEFGRLRDVIQGPDGYLYFATSNQDGRGKPAAEDDQIIRIKGLP
jgi:glucose/arabinose dehydrogenase